MIAIMGIPVGSIGQGLGVSAVCGYAGIGAASGGLPAR